MANQFKVYASNNVGTSITTIGGYTVGASNTATVIGLCLANKHSAAITATVYYHDGTNLAEIVKDAPIAAGGSLVPIGGDQKLVLEAGDSVRCVSNTASSVSAVMSLLEIY